MRRMDIFNTESCCRAETLVDCRKTITLIEADEGRSNKPLIKVARHFRCSCCGRNWFSKCGEKGFWTASGEG